MPNVKDYQDIKTAWSRGKNWVEVTYDFAKDAGAQAVYELCKFGFPAIITAFYAKVATAVTSAGAPTVDVGIKTTDPDALMDGLLKGDFTKDAVVYDGTNQIIPLKVEKDAELAMTTAVADITAGKVTFVIEYEKYFV